MTGMKLWLSGLAFLLLIVGVLVFQNYDVTALDPFRIVSMPAPPETDFVPTSGEV